MPRHPEQLPERWEPPPEAGPHLVQILRTYPAKRPAYPFAPAGERSIAKAYSRAFARARRLIYIEDQYFWSDTVATTLADALRREPELQVIAVVPRYPEEDNRIGGPPMMYGQRLAWDLLHEAGGDRFAMFDLENAAGTPIYVHAKVCVVDDHWMTIGSDNLNLRSWTHDSELTCAVVDPEGELPRSLRTSLWAEHLGLPPDDPRLSDLSGALALWTERVGASGSRIGRHVPHCPLGAYAAVGPGGVPHPLRPGRPAAETSRHDRLLRVRLLCVLGPEPLAHRLDERPGLHIRCPATSSGNVDYSDDLLVG